MPMTTASPVMNQINTLSVPASGGAAMGSTPARSPGAKAGESAAPDSFSRALNQANDPGANAQRSGAPRAQVSNRPERVDMLGKSEAATTDNTESAAAEAKELTSADAVTAAPDAAAATDASVRTAWSPEAPTPVPVEPTAAPDVSTLLSGWIAQNPIGRLPEVNEAEDKADPNASSVPTLGLLQVPPDVALGALQALAVGDPRQPAEAHPAASARRAAPVASEQSGTQAGAPARAPSTASQTVAAISSARPPGLGRLAAAAQGAQANGSEAGVTGPAQINPTAALAAATLAAAENLTPGRSTAPPPLNPTGMAEAAAANSVASGVAAAKEVPTTLLEGRLAASPGSAEFAPQLSAQLSLLVRAGVHQARLQLNPAEMGPLSLQIQLDGTAAQVLMAAEHPLTRQALEQAMPQLASALRDMGLTLTGGGVFDQARDNPARDAQGGPGKPGGAAAEAQAQAEGRPLAVAALRQRGVVDLVA